MAVAPEKANAVCEYEGQCDNGSTCRCLDASCNVIVADSGMPCGSNVGSKVVGAVVPPAAIRTRFGDGVGIIAFLSIIIRLVAIVGGILAMLNFVAAGFIYITSMGNTQANTQVREKLTFSVIGLLVIVSAYTIAAIVGLIFFGDATFILEPTIKGALEQ